MIESWPCPLPGGGTRDELALRLAAAVGLERGAQVLVIPALFDEANRMRRLSVEVMRRLSASGVGAVLPEIPGLGDSLADLTRQTPGDWRLAMLGAARHFGATHVLAIRGGALIAPDGLPGWRYAPVTGASQMRQMLRARIVAARELGVEEKQDSLMAQGREAGLELVGYRLGAEFVAEFPGLVVNADSPMRDIAPDLVPTPGLWLRAEPGENAAQADALAAVVMMGITAGDAA
ncbi:hypothetical protein GTZ99_05775 [Novosphingobium sp. FSY-8]|uniref:Uncharacterized protein n=2 Tax=Novosphingobium ovatum TaxID=1908523 RepID=A0ABW9XBY9_9SPHN|nr:hypothetical protein [Novosphingobium ovatum]